MNTIRFTQIMVNSIDIVLLQHAAANLSLFKSYITRLCYILKRFYYNMQIVKLQKHASIYERYVKTILQQNICAFTHEQNKLCKLCMRSFQITYTVYTYTYIIVFVLAYAHHISHNIAI